jgi:hypothetical protein
MPDVWETNNGFNPQSPSDASGDSDGDGYTNLEEFLNGNNPGSQLSPPENLRVIKVQ